MGVEVGGFGWGVRGGGEGEGGEGEEGGEKLKHGWRRAILAETISATRRPVFDSRRSCVDILLFPHHPRPPRRAIVWFRVLQAAHVCGGGVYWRKRGRRTWAAAGWCDREALRALMHRDYVACSFVFSTMEVELCFPPGVAFPLSNQGGVALGLSASKAYWFSQKRNREDCAALTIPQWHA